HGGDMLWFHSMLEMIPQHRVGLFVSYNTDTGAGVSDDLLDAFRRRYFPDPDAWARMVAHLRRAETEVARNCRILMDLAGPKLRTGPLEPGPRVVKWRPQRNLRRGSPCGCSDDPRSRGDGAPAAPVRPAADAEGL